VTVGLHAAPRPELLAAPARGQAGVFGLGSARASRTVSGAALTERFGKSAEWLLVRTGITSVQRLAPGETLPDLSVAAARNALTDAELDAADIDLVVVATCSADPTQGPLSRVIARRLAPRAMSFDVNAACAGFCYALSAAGALVSTGAAQRVLVVGAEQMSTLIDPADLGTSILFGDGAGAAVVGAARDDRPGISAPAWSSDGAQAGLLEVPPGETALRMAGSQVFRWAVDEVHKVATTALARAGVRAEDIDVFVPHQANLRIVEAIAKRLGLTRAETATDVVDAGNTSAASIPLALTRLRERGASAGGQLALLIGFGAGLSIAAQVVRLP
jgi:3-oxoacyl-[acyl-carrier-protein] synthase III